MKKVATMLTALTFFPALALAAMLNGTVMKVDKDKKEDSSQDRYGTGNRGFYQRHEGRGQSQGRE